MAMPNRQPPQRSSALKRYGPLLAVVAVIGVIAAVTMRSRTDSKDTASSDGTAPVGSSANLPMLYNEAKARGADLSVYGDNCDPNTGRIKMPSIFAPPCVPEWKGGDNGGATYQGVTKDKVIIAEYIPQTGGDLAALLQGLLDPREQVEQTQEAYRRMFNDLFETYGREVVIVPVEGSGSAGDETAARADAIKVAEEIGAFASLGGPALAQSYADELASRGVLCIACGQGVPDSKFQANAPYMWGPLATPEEFLLNLGDLTTGMLMNKPAQWAGGELKDRTRRFGVVHFEQEVPVFKELRSQVLEEGKRRGFEAVVTETYTLDPNNLGKLTERAPTIIAKMKQAEVTTIIFLGDPLMPMYLTKAATEQGYFPEWVVTGTVLTDTTTFGRMYDQQQWRHAFGIATLPARLPKSQGESARVHRWYYGEDPAAKSASQLLYPNLQMIWLGLHLAGPNLTPETFRDGLFRYPPSGGGPTTPQISFGRHGFFKSPLEQEERTDYLGVDDISLVWWDPEVEGWDESEKNYGKGMYRYIRMGERYLPGKLQPGDFPGFDPTDTVTMYDLTGEQGPKPPERDIPPEYPSPNKSLPKI